MGREEVIYYSKIAKTLYTSSHSLPLQIIGVVKIKAKIIVWSLMLLFVVGIVSANCLDIIDVTFEVDGKKESGTTIDVKPESNLEVNVKIDNICENPDIDLESVFVRATIEGIDDSDDLEEESDDFDLNAGRSKKETLRFNIPLEVEDEDYPLTIWVEGRQENDSSIRYNETNDYNIDVNKQKNDVVIRTAELGNNALKCSRTTDLELSLINLGTEDEEGVEIKVTNSELGLSIKNSDTIDLSSDPFDSDSKYSNSYSIKVAEDQAAGTYPVKVEVAFDDGDKKISKTADLTVEDCPVAKEVKEEVEVVQEPAQTTPATTDDVVEAEITEEQPEGIMGISKLMISIIAIEVLVILGGVLLVAKWLRKK